MNETLNAPLIREMSLSERNAAVGDIHSWMEFPLGADLAKSYPQIFRSEGRALSLGAYREGALCSHTTYRRVELVGSRGPIHATLVGDVATSPAHRGTGLASSLLQELATKEQAAGQDCLLLWSDLWDFYARFGFAPAGVQCEVQLQPTQPVSSPHVREARVSDLVAMMELHAQKPWRIERNLEEVALLLSVPGMDCWVFEMGNEILAYACHGKGVDLQGWWHELGGGDQELKVLLPAAMTQLGQSKATAIIPPYRHNLLSDLSGLYRECREGIVALCKPLSTKGICDFFIDGLDSI